MSIRNISAIALLIFVLSACSSPKNIVYFQDVTPGKELQITPASQIKIQPMDQLQIVVSTPDQRLTDQLNLTMGSNSSAAQQEGVGYTVDAEGNIKLPMIGTLYVAGMSRDQLAETIRQQILNKNLVKDPVVVVQFQNLGVSVLGEVKDPGRVPIKKDKITLIEALAQAGDLTINGQRENVMVMRQEGNKEKVYIVDLTNAQSIYSSPAYYLQQDDVVYVTPNKKAARNATANGNTLQSAGFWMSLLTLLVSVTTIVIK